MRLRVRVSGSIRHYQRMAAPLMLVNWTGEGD